MKNEGKTRPMAHSEISTVNFCNLGMANLTTPTHLHDPDGVIVPHGSQEHTPQRDWTRELRMVSEHVGKKKQV